MLTFEIEWPGGKHHATPWDRQVNEGVVEWPPSPWRLLRAIVATWHLKFRDDIEKELVEELVEAFAGVEPRYRLPTEVSEAHSRHYMPIRKGNSPGSTKIFDAWLNVPRGEKMLVGWPGVELDQERRDALEKLVENIAYLGRHESWVAARVVDSDDTTFNCLPDVGIGDGEIVRVLSPAAPETYASFREQAVQRHLDRRLQEKREDYLAKGKDPDDASLTRTDKRNAEDLPRTTLEILEARTDHLQSAGWSQPPGTRWLSYRRPSIKAAAPFSASPSPTRADKPTVARFAIDHPAPPRLTSALAWGNAWHRALGHHAQGHVPVLTGTHENGDKLRGHDHVFILPESHGDHGRLTHVTLHASGGFDAHAVRAIEKIREVWIEKPDPHRYILIGFGLAEELGGLDASIGQIPLLAESTTWVSRTPFVSTLYPKRTKSGEKKLDERGIWRGGPEYDLRRLLRHSGYPEPSKVEPIESTDLGGKEVRWLEFKTHVRGRTGARGPTPPTGFRIVFDQPVRGPISLGYGAHYGLGRFEPAP